MALAVSDKLGRLLARAVGRDEGASVLHLRQRLGVVLLSPRFAFSDSFLTNPEGEVLPHNIFCFKCVYAKQNPWDLGAPSWLKKSGLASTSGVNIFH